MLLDKVCNYLNIKTEQPWFGWDNDCWNLYKLCDDGTLMIKEYSGGPWSASYSGWMKILLGEIKPLEEDLYCVFVDEATLKLLPGKYDELLLTYNNKKQKYEWLPYSYEDEGAQYMFTESDMKRVKEQNNMSLYNVEKVVW